MLVVKTKTSNPSISRGSALWRLLLSALLLLAVNACTTTVKPQVGMLPDPSPPLNESVDHKLANMSVEDLLRDGHKYLAQGNPQLAGLYFNLARMKEPDNLPALYGQGEILRLQADFAGAQPIYEKILSLDQDSPKALLSLGEANLYQGNYDKAASYLQRVLEKAPDHPQALSLLAMTWDGAGETAKAETLYLRLAHISPRSAAVHNNLGVNRLFQGRYQEAISSLSIAVNLDPDNKRTQNNLAMAYALAGDESQALEIFQQSLGKAAAYNNMGYLYMKKGMFADAEKSLLKAIEYNPSYYPQAQRNLQRLQAMRTTEGH